MAQSTSETTYDSILLVAFGGPASAEESYDFVKGIVGNRPAAEARIREVASHYEKLGGSPFNALTFEQADLLHHELVKRGIGVPVRVGLRHWTPYLQEVVKELTEAGQKRPLGIIMAPHQCWVSWDWYKDTVSQGIKDVEGGGMEISYADPWWVAPEFIQANADRVQEVLDELGEGAPDAKLIFSAHSIPVNACAHCRGGERSCPYTDQFEESARLVAEALGRGDDYCICYQSQSEFSRQWTEPEVAEIIRQCRDQGVKKVVLIPIGFLVDHVEVLWDLDVEAKECCEENGLEYHRAGTVGSHPAFIKLLADRVVARFEDQPRIEAPLK